MEGYKWQHDKELTSFYQTELDILRSGFNGDFQLTEGPVEDTDGRISVYGWLKYNNEDRLPIQITFPTKYPNAAPAIKVCHQNPTKPGGFDKTQFALFQKGNQYNDGKLCLIREDQWQKDFHNIGWILRRTQKWLVSAYSEGGFKKEEIVEEFPYLLPPQGKVLIPKALSLPEGKTGVIHLTQFKPNYFLVEKNILQRNPFPVELSVEPFRYYMFDEGVTLKSLINDKPFLYGTIAQILKNFGETIKSQNIAFYTPSDSVKWHFFKLIVINNQILQQPLYFPSHIIEDEIYHRTKTLFSDKILNNKRVTIIGLGAIGSEVARSLAKNGVGYFQLVDNQHFEIGNCVRHAADLSYLGETKVAAVGRLIQCNNPNITVDEYFIDVLDDVGIIEDCLLQSDLCIVLTAEDSVDYFFNKIYVPQYNIPFVFARSSPGALSGSIQVVINGQTACLKCLALHRTDKLPIPNGEVSIEELSAEVGGCSTPAVPGSEIDTKEISLQVARIALQLLLDGCSNYAPRAGDQYYWHGPYGTSDSTPFSWEIQKYPIHHECPICNH